jgi:toxin ParE1/3/4
MKFAFHPEARLEFVEAARYYEQRRAGLGARFSVEVEAAIGRILEAPLRWPAIEQDVRRYLTHVFPYGIL